MLSRTTLDESLSNRKNPDSSASAQLSSTVAKILGTIPQNNNLQSSSIEMSLVAGSNSDSTHFARKKSPTSNNAFLPEYVPGHTEPYEYEYYSQYKSDAAKKKELLCRLTEDAFEDDFSDTFDRRARIEAPPPSLWNCVKHAFSMPNNKGTERLRYTKNRYIVPHL